MREPKKTIEEIKADLLDPAFNLIINHLISRGCEEPEIISTKDSLAITFNDKRGKEYSYKCYINANGKVYRNMRRPPDTGTDLSGVDAPKVTPQMILDDFTAFFEIIIRPKK